MQSRVRDKQEDGRNRVADKLEIWKEVAGQRWWECFAVARGIFTHAILLLVTNLDSSIVLSADTSSRVLRQNRFQAYNVIGAKQSR